MKNNEIISWLLQGDFSIQYQTYRDLLGIDKVELRSKIEKEGWGSKFLSFRNQNGHWGNGFYFPKWTLSHYTLFDLKNLNISKTNPLILQTIDLIFDNEKGHDGGLNPNKNSKHSDVCVNGIALNYASYFGTSEEKLKSIIDYLLSKQMNDGGFNCQIDRIGAHHSSFHSTLSVIEGIHEYKLNSYTYRLNELLKVVNESKEFLLKHKLYLSDKTGEIINTNFIKFYFPTRYYYDILRAMDYFRHSETVYDNRMNDALNLILKKRNKNETWDLKSIHKGEILFNMEETGKPSRWNTLRAMRVLKYYNMI